MKIIIDAMGGDNAPAAVVKGAVRAKKELGVDIVLVGRKEDVKACLKTFGEQAIAIWKNGERIGYLALCGGNQVVEAEVLEEQDFVPALAAYLYYRRRKNGRRKR